MLRNLPPVSDQPRRQLRLRVVGVSTPHTAYDELPPPLDPQVEFVVVEAPRDLTQEEFPGLLGQEVLLQLGPARPRPEPSAARVAVVASDETYSRTRGAIARLLRRRPR